MAAEKTAEKKSNRRRRDKEADDKAVAEGKGRATPGRRSSSGRSESSGNALTRPFTSLFEYLGEVQSELSKVTWPTREEVARLTRIVLLVTVAASLVLGGLSIVLGEYIRLGLDTPLLFVVLLVAAVGGVFVLMRRG